MIQERPRGAPERLREKLINVWGVIQTTSEDKKQLMAKFKAALTPEALAKADLPNGRAVFNRACFACHKLFGEGGDIGPELTGSDRANLDYVLINVIDPRRCAIWWRIWPARSRWNDSNEPRA